MKKIFFSALVGFFALLIVTPSLTPAQAAVSGWQQKGVSIQSKWSGDFDTADFRKSVDNAAGAGANYIALIIPIYQSNTGSTDIQSGGDTPTDAALASAINYVHSKGMHVMLKPHLNTFSGEWRAYINPSDRNAWFTNFTNMLVHIGNIGQVNHAEDFCLGTELIDMAAATVNSSNTQNWVNLIATVRKTFTGKLTYSANWGPNGFVDEKNNIQFWGSLDYIGISAYYNLNTNNQVQNMENAWSNYSASDIQPLSQRFNKPVVFTEIGYQSKPNAQQEPWNYNLGGGPDMTTQQNAYEALFGFWNAQSFMQGVELWDWDSNPNAGGTGDTGYTPQNKPAQDTMKKWFSGPGMPPPPPPGSFNASAANQSAQPGASVTVPISVLSSASASNLIVDIEFYNAAGSRVLQKIYDGVVFNAGETKSFSANWNAGSSGTYTVKVGVFNGDWSKNYYWNNGVAQISVGGSATPPPNSGINIWWPTNNATISGAQPFKAMLTNADVSSYNMYWQVDGGGLVAMPTNTTDYPHKEFDTDVSSWTWRNNGPYTINFIAKNLSGTTLAQQSITVFVSH